MHVGCEMRCAPKASARRVAGTASAISANASGSVDDSAPESESERR